MSFNAVDFEGIYFDNLEDAAYALLNHNIRYVTDIDGYIMNRTDFDHFAKWVEGGYKEDEYKAKLGNSLTWDREDAENIVNGKKLVLLSE